MANDGRLVAGTRGAHVRTSGLDLLRGLRSSHVKIHHRLRYCSDVAARSIDRIYFCRIHYQYGPNWLAFNKVVIVISNLALKLRMLHTIVSQQLNHPHASNLYILLSFLAQWINSRLSVRQLKDAVRSFLRLVTIRSTLCRKAHSLESE